MDLYNYYQIGQVGLVSAHKCPAITNSFGPLVAMVIERLPYIIFLIYIYRERERERGYSHVG